MLSGIICDLELAEMRVRAETNWQREGTGNTFRCNS